MEQGTSALAATLISAWKISPWKFAVWTSVIGPGTWAFIAVSFCVLTVLVYVAIRSNARPIDLEKAVQSFQSLDIDAFKNLIDPSEETFLRCNLPPKKFREIKRQRTRVALIYSHEIGKAASTLVTIGQAAKRSSDPRMVRSGTELTENALRLRLKTFGTEASLLIDFILPNLRTRTLPRLVDEYERAAQTLFRLRGFSTRTHELVRLKSI